MFFVFFFFNDTATTEIYTLSLHDALPILIALDVNPAIETLWPRVDVLGATCDLTDAKAVESSLDRGVRRFEGNQDRKSTRLNSSHLVISYAVFCLKKKTTRTVNSNA